MTRWTPELIDAACADYEARQYEVDCMRLEAYAEGRKDEREAILVEQYGNKMSQFESHSYGVSRIDLARTLKAIAHDVSIMLASAQQHSDGETVTGYTIKTGALHRIIGELQSAGYPVSVPAAPRAR